MLSNDNGSEQIRDNNYAHCNRHTISTDNTRDNEYTPERPSPNPMMHVAHSSSISATFLSSPYFSYCSFLLASPALTMIHLIILLDAHDYTQGNDHRLGIGHIRGHNHTHIAKTTHTVFTTHMVFTTYKK